MSFEWGGTFFLNPIFCSIVIVTVSVLMISRVPTFSLKKTHITQRFVLPLLLFVALLAASIFSAPWFTLSMFAISYVVTIPFSIFTYKRIQRKYI
jgi:CDP-diacylglycerol--serine O-phosphatidyltransferase